MPIDDDDDDDVDYTFCFYFTYQALSRIYFYNIAKKKKYYSA
jgi:hypothetical protein